MLAYIRGMLLLLGVSGAFLALLLAPKLEKQDRQRLLQLLFPRLLSDDARTLETEVSMFKDSRDVDINGGEYTNVMNSGPGQIIFNREYPLRIL